MNSETYQNIEIEALNRLEKQYLSQAEKLSAKQKIEDVLEEKVAEGDVLIVSHEEERMLRCFRQFKMTKHKPGAIFKWQTHPEAGIGVVADDDQAMIVDPQDAND